LPPSPESTLFYPLAECGAVAPFVFPNRWPDQHTSGDSYVVFNTTEDSDGVYVTQNIQVTIVRAGVRLGAFSSIRWMLWNPVDLMRSGHAYSGQLFRMSKLSAHPKKGSMIFPMVSR
jgi:hypothetical protein